MEAIKKGSLAEKTGLTCIFEEVLIRNWRAVSYKYQIQQKKTFATAQITTSVTHLQTGSNCQIFLPFDLSVPYILLWQKGFFVEKVLTLFLCDCLFPLCYFYHGQEWDINISSLLRLLLKVQIWYRLNNNIEKHYYHDGEQQLRFHKNIQIYRSSKKKNAWNALLLHSA